MARKVSEKQKYLIALQQDFCCANKYSTNILEGYNPLLLDRYKEEVSCNSVGARGWMLGNGLIWIQSYGMKNSAKVIAVNKK